MRQGRFAALAVASVVLMSAGGVAVALPASTQVRSIAHPDAEIFMRVNATPKQNATLRNRLRKTDAVRRFAFLSHEAATREFRRLYGEDALLTDEILGEMLPTSFRVTFVKGAKRRAFERAFGGRSGVDEVVLARGEAMSDLERQCGFLQRNPRAGDIEVFMGLGATEVEIEAVRNALRQSPEVRAFTFISRREALREFRKMFADNPNLLHDTTADGLPTSFRVELKLGPAVEPFLGVVDSLPGVDEIRVQITPADCAAVRSRSI